MSDILAHEEDTEQNDLPYSSEAEDTTRRHRQDISDKILEGKIENIQSHENEDIDEDPIFNLRRIANDSLDKESDESIEMNSPTPGARRSTRIRKPPTKWWKTNPSKPSAMFAFRAMGLDPDLVKEARQREYKTLIEKQVWDLTILPKGSKAIPCFFVDTQKKADDGKQTGTYKSRLVLDGSKTRKGIDYEETFAPTIKLVTLRMMLSTGNHFDMEMKQSDFKAAYVNAKMDRELYMKQPPGFYNIPDQLRGKGPVVCKLNKALYGANPSGRLWNQDLTRWLTVEQKFKQNQFDQCLFIRGSFKDKNIIMLAIWTDDNFAIYYSHFQKQYDDFMRDLSAKYEISKAGDMTRYVSMDIFRNRSTRELTISHENSVKDLLKEYGLDICKNRSVPMIPGFSLVVDDSEPTIKMSYRSVVGSINFLNQYTRPDLSYAVSTLSRYNTNP